LGYLDIVEILVNICVAALGTTIIYYLILFIYMFRKKNPNWWFWGTILLIIFLFYTGIMIIDSKIGIKVIRLKLRNQDGSIYAEKGIECSKNFLVGENVSCAVLPFLRNTTVNITFIFENGTKEIINDLTFIAPNNLQRICFDVEGLDSNNLKKHLSVCNSYHFLTNEEYTERKKIFLSYVFGLFGLIFVTVPIVVLNFKKLLGKVSNNYLSGKFSVYTNSPIV